jgi:hypothetical protein
LIIRREQVDSIQQAMDARYHEEVRTLFREQFPQLVGRLDDRALTERIAAGSKDAARLGLKTREGFLAYLALSFCAGPAFNRSDEVRRFLELADGDRDVRIRWLLTRALEKLQGN